MEVEEIAIEVHGSYTGGAAPLLWATATYKRREGFIAMDKEGLHAKAGQGAPVQLTSRPARREGFPGRCAIQRCPEHGMALG